MLSSHHTKTCCSLIVFITLTVTTVTCSLIVEDSFLFSSSLNPSDDYPNYTRSCEAFFNAYVDAAGKFTHCELLHAKPFRICTKCFVPYAIMNNLYTDLTEDPKLHTCMVKYLKSDRVQIIPTMQRNADKLWKTSDCDGCVSHLKVDPVTKKVSYKVPEDTSTFLNLYENMTRCLDYPLPTADKNVSKLCRVCKASYNQLNNHYDKMARHTEGEVCMDVVDMMNYTRVAWSDNLNCSHRTGDSVYVVIITLVVAVSPLFFYLPLRYTSKETMKQLLKQKRLNHEGIVTSVSASFAAGDSRGRPSTHLPPMGS